MLKMIHEEIVKGFNFEHRIARESNLFQQADLEKMQPPYT